MWDEGADERRYDEHHPLEDQQVEVPSPEPEVVRGDLVELEEEHQGDECRLCILCKARESTLGSGGKRRHEMKEEAERNARRHRQRQHPVVQEILNLSHPSSKALQISLKRGLRAKMFLIFVDIRKQLHILKPVKDNTNLP